MQMLYEAGSPAIVRDDAHAALAALFHPPAGRGDWTHARPHAFL